MIRGWTKREFSKILLWGSFFQQHLLRQKSMASLLWIVQQSQDSFSRKLWYETCFFFACLSKISERPFRLWFDHRWLYSFFFFLKDQTFFFRSLEYHFAKVDGLQFGSKYFRGTSYKVTTHLLPYDRFHLRAPATLYLLLWYHSEQIRMRFFDDYVKSHDLINHSFFLPCRFRYQKTLWSYRVRGCRKQLLRWFFFFSSRQNRYTVMEFQAFDTRNSFSFFSFSQVVPPVLLSSSSSLELTLATKMLPLKYIANVRQRFFLGTFFMQLNLWSNTLLADDPLKFYALVRMDWAHYLFSLPVFVFTFRIHQWFWLWQKRLITKFVSTVFKEYRRSTFDFSLLSSLKNSLLPLKSNLRFFFLWWVLDFRINRFWNHWVFNRWSTIPAYTDLRTKAKMFPLNYQFFSHMRFSRHFLRKVALYGNSPSISIFFSRTILPLDFLYWRMSSNGFTYRQFMGNGLFSLDSFYRRLTLDHYARERFSAFRFYLEYLMRTQGVYCSTGLTWKGENRNPFPKVAPFVRLPNNQMDPQEPRWSFSAHFFAMAFRRFFLACLRRSKLLSLFSFFLFLDGKCRKPYRLVFLFSQMTRAVVGHRRFLNLYKYSHLKQFRRYPHKVFVHSRLDPSFRARWFSFADRMRRAGIKRSQLPYYPENDSMDIILDLKKIYKKASWVQKPRYWIINSSL